MPVQTCGSLPEIIRNDDDLYEGNLIHYFRAVFYQARNLHYPYHNFRHIMHVVWLCYQACIFYWETLTPRSMRNLLIAALFHDFDHSGSFGEDSFNIEMALIGLNRYILPEDLAYLTTIEHTIRVTEFPYIVIAKLNLPERIIRNADLSQALSEAWLQQVIFGLSEERWQTPLEILGQQVAFLEKLRFNTDWARQLFPPTVIQAKIAETREFLELLKEKPASALIPA